MQINPPVVFTFTRQRWSSNVTTFSLLLAFAVWASNTYFIPGSSYLFFLAVGKNYLFDETILNISRSEPNLCCFSLNLNIIEAGHVHSDYIRRHTSKQYFNAFRRFFKVKTRDFSTHPFKHLRDSTVFFVLHGIFSNFSIHRQRNNTMHSPTGQIYGPQPYLVWSTWSSSISLI